MTEGIIGALPHHGDLPLLGADRARRRARSSARWSASCVLVGVALLLGFRPTAGPLGWLAAAGLIALLALALTWLAVAIGLLARNPQGTSAFMLVVQLLPFLSSAFVPTGSMSAAVRWFAQYEPFTPIIDTLRGLLLGTPARRQRGRRGRAGAPGWRWPATCGRGRCSGGTEAADRAARRRRPRAAASSFRPAYDDTASCVRRPVGVARRPAWPARRTWSAGIRAGSAAARASATMRAPALVAPRSRPPWPGPAAPRRSTAKRRPARPRHRHESGQRVDEVLDQVEPAVPGVRDHGHGLRLRPATVTCRPLCRNRCTASPPQPQPVVDVAAGQPDLGAHGHVEHRQAGRFRHLLATTAGAVPATRSASSSAPACRLRQHHRPPGADDGRPRAEFLHRGQCRWPCA